MDTPTLGTTYNEDLPAGVERYALASAPKDAFRAAAASVLGTISYVREAAAGGKISVAGVCCGGCRIVPMSLLTFTKWGQVVPFEQIVEFDLDDTCSCCGLYTAVKGKGTYWITTG